MLYLRLLRASAPLVLVSASFTAADRGLHRRWCANVCGPYPIGVGPKLQKKYGSFVVDYANGQIALSAKYADGGTCNLAPVPMLSADAVYAQGFVGGDFNAAATASCPELPGGLQLRVNGQTLIARTLDLCTTGNVRASASYNNR